MRTLEWDEPQQALRLIDQRLLPVRLEFLLCRRVDEVSEAIVNMAVRGAPAIGVAAAFGVALAALRSSATDVLDLLADVRRGAESLLAARPTAVNLAWAVQRMMRVAEMPLPTVEKLQLRLLAEAQRMAEEDVLINRRMAEHGAMLIRDGDTILHHCNTGALAAVDWGTALGAIRLAHEQGKRLFVLVDETRPRLQGARLTAWELAQYGIPHALIVDGAAGYFLRRGEVQKVFFGADRVAANGDVANKVGSYMLALAARANDVPVYSVMPTSTIDMSLPDGDLIPIEERDPQEVLGLQLNGDVVTPPGSAARNPAFDVTPHELLTALVTERGVVYPPFVENLRRVFEAG
ncbi:MAG: S-methyl-5-thioribose-1-phosphate isomerase [Anaerolinea sp.]|nr:S-methyl-5-thioribose-1-phosphate isomerase [Anaerolinea sp.]